MAQALSASVNGGNNMNDEPKNILLVDDNSVNLTAIKSALTGLYKVTAVNSGALALRFLEKHRPDLILLDVDMPEMTGPELLKILQDDPGLSDIPVIFLTANTDEESEAEAFLLGAVDYIRKPMNKVIGLARVKTHLELAELRAAVKNL